MGMKRIPRFRENYVGLPLIAEGVEISHQLAQVSQALFHAPLVQNEHRGEQESSWPITDGISDLEVLSEMCCIVCLICYTVFVFRFVLEIQEL